MGCLTEPVVLDARPVEPHWMPPRMAASGVIAKSETLPVTVDDNGIRIPLVLSLLLAR